jgi:hypothetical protein
MIVGFTGTQHGMTDEQKIQVRSLLTNHYDYHGDNWFHHGDCIGADHEADLIAREMGWRIHIHPPTKPDKRAFCEVRPKDVRDRAYGYLIRNQHIVKMCDMLIACPRRAARLRSGTWYTLNYAIEQNRSRVTVYPDGHLYVRFVP